MSTPWNVSLPTTLTAGGEEHAIRSDYRAALDIFLALTDTELDDFNRSMELLDILYVDDIPPEHWQEAIDRGFWFLNGGEPERDVKQPPVVNWEKDFNLIAAPISKIVGQDIRGVEYMHWWTFLQCYQSIGDCLFAQIVRIRDKKARGKALDKADQEFYRRNRDLIDLKTVYTEQDNEILKQWGGG